MNEHIAGYQDSQLQDLQNRLPGISQQTAQVLGGVDRGQGVELSAFNNEQSMGEQATGTADLTPRANEAARQISLKSGGSETFSMSSEDPSLTGLDPSQARSAVIKGLSLGEQIIDRSPSKKLSEASPTEDVTNPYASVGTAIFKPLSGGYAALEVASVYAADGSMSFNVDRRPATAEEQKTARVSEARHLAGQQALAHV